ncbi:MAG: NUDIX hydrolase [Elusimicrobiaceae bacterium]|uniref:NUDIX domain-containing protein n=1 Tax=Candidatus Avelusimicrobium faecicola TaxID=3416205 RepID=UPI002A7E15B9|nr:NUDIX hydrolase [Spirochaetota bacterium]MDY2940260.1 NUDIX hydrolase [Elusimicrobiaceae bacterium]
MKHYSKLKETKISSKTLYEGILNVKLDEVRLINGKTSNRLYFDHRGASGILPVEDGNVYLVQQFRYPIGQTTLEIPAGKREENQTFLMCAEAELKQETGLTAQHLQEIMVFHPCNAFSNEVQHLYLATGLTRGEDQPDEDEFLNLKKFPLEEAYQMIADGRITDAKTIITLQWYQLHANK